MFNPKNGEVWVSERDAVREWGGGTLTVPGTPIELEPDAAFAMMARPQRWSDTCCRGVEQLCRAVSLGGETSVDGPGSRYTPRDFCTKRSNGFGAGGLALCHWIRSPD